MTLGEKIKQARLEAGLSQRQLCGETVTRNMLSQIENGSARPSMGTLSYFAAQLGKPISYFLEEDAVLSPNQTLMRQAREAVRSGNGAAALDILRAYRGPDDTFDAEFQLLHPMAVLAAAKSAMAKGQNAYAAELLEELGEIRDSYCAQDLERQRLLLLARVRPQRRGEICRKLPSMDEELLLRARQALDMGDLDRGEALLIAAQDQKCAEWNFLRGEVHLARRQLRDAVGCYRKAEEAYPEKTARRLEYCYRELEDFKQAYFYACKQRSE